MLRPRLITSKNSRQVTTLKSLKLFGLAQAIEELAAQNSPAHLNAQSILDRLLKAKLSEWEVRSVNYQMKIARFPTYRDLSGFDFSQSVVNEALVRHLRRGKFMDSAHNVVLVGQALARPIWLLFARYFWLLLIQKQPASI